MKYVELNNGVKMPILGFGVLQLTDPEECERCVLDAIDVGYRLIDTAQGYGNEVVVGNAIQKSSVPREEQKYGVQVQAGAPFARGKNNLFTDETLGAIGDKYNKSNAQVALRYLVQNNVAVVPKTSRKERMIENLDVFDFELTSEDMGRIADLDKGETSFFSHQDPEQVERLVNWERSF